MVVGAGEVGRQDEREAAGRTGGGQRAHFGFATRAEVAAAGQGAVACTNCGVVLGDAERLEREVVKLVSAMERDSVDVHTVWVEDAPHDVLMMGWWDERVRDGVWRQVEEWVAEVLSKKEKREKERGNDGKNNA